MNTATVFSVPAGPPLPVVLSTASEIRDGLCDRALLGPVPPLDIDNAPRDLGGAVGQVRAHPRCALWAAPTRLDADGREVVQVLAAIDRADLWDVRALQAAVGVEVDGAYGPITHGAVVRWAAARQGATPC